MGSVRVPLKLPLALFTVPTQAIEVCPTLFSLKVLSKVNEVGSNAAMASGKPPPSMITLGKVMVGDVGSPSDVAHAAA